MLQKLRQIYEDVEQTLVEGSYRSSPHSFWSRIIGKKDDLPDTTELAVGTSMVDMSRVWGVRILWTAAVAALSTCVMVWAAAAIGIVGAGMLIAEYEHARRARKDIITEVNFAGQRVQGMRADLCRLHIAQVRIMNLANAFRPASEETTHDTVQEIIDSVKGESKRVKIVDPGRYDADRNAYDFSEPGIKLVNDKNNPHHIAHTIAAATPGLKDAWDNKRMTADEVVDHLAQLENALPPELQERLAKKRAQAQVSA